MRLLRNRKKMLGRDGNQPWPSRSWPTGTHAFIRSYGALPGMFAYTARSPHADPRRPASPRQRTGDLWLMKARRVR